MAELDEDCNIEHLKDKFYQNAKDEEWLKYAGEREMIVITRDQKIRKRPQELLAYRRYNVRAFFLTGKRLGKWQEIKQLINHWEEMKNIVINSRRPFAFQVPQKGKIRELTL